MFHLDFRFNAYDNYRQIIQNSKLNGKWSYIYDGSRTNLPDFRLKNDVFILVTSQYYEVTVNGIAIEPRFPVDLDRLYDYRGIKIGVLGTCATIDMNKSYLADGGRLYQCGTFTAKIIRTIHETCPLQTGLANADTKGWGRGREVGNC